MRFGTQVDILLDASTLLNNPIYRANIAILNHLRVEVRHARSALYGPHSCTKPRVVDATREVRDLLSELVDDF